MTNRLLAFATLVVSLGIQPAEAQQAAGAAAPACAEGGRLALTVLDSASTRLEGARQANSVADMRAAMTDVQNALSSMRTNLAACRDSSAPATEAPAAVAAAVPDKAIDPVCGMTVIPKKAAGTATVDGKAYYFCSIGDRDKFMKDPGKYVKK